MGISTNSHGKIDKETQSPLLKIFKEIMTREKDDPEKRNLLTEQKEENKKKRQYSASRSAKTERRSCESSSSEHRKRGGPYKPSLTEQRAEYKQTRAMPPYQSEKKDSWWFWQHNQEKNPSTKQITADTCSCVSCALKKIVSSEYACVGILLCLFSLSIVVAFCIVFKNVPSLGAECKDCKQMSSSPPPTTTCKCQVSVSDSERLKRKIEMLSDTRFKPDISELDEFRKNDKDGYNDELSGNPKSPGVAGIDFGPSFRELNSLEESESKLSNENDWASVLESSKNIDMQNSDKLREFYSKLVQTDAQIKSLKKLGQGNVQYADYDVYKKSPDRSKRSLKLYNYPQRYVIRHRKSLFNKHHNTNENSPLKRRFGNKTRLKRYINDAEEPSGFVIEKKKLIVQYKPSGRKKVPVKKCSHAPKDPHFHENQLKHPFYKNSQRLDELLDNFLNKNLPEIMTDPFGLDVLFKHDKPNKCKHPKPFKTIDIMGTDQLLDQIPKPKGKFKKIKNDKADSSVDDIMKMLAPETTTQFETEFYHREAQMIGKEKQKIVTASTDGFEVMLSVSTIMPNKSLNVNRNPDSKVTENVHKTSPVNKMKPMIDMVPNLRRLMQLDGEDEENLGYEDFKEVLTDDMENHDENDRTGDRIKRNDMMKLESTSLFPSEKFSKYNRPGVHNPNWKGPMPLYPDELNSMLRPAVINANNKIETPSTTQFPVQSESIQRKERDITDVEYVEDYLKNRYEKLVGMAQAYSDYGVLDGKNEPRNEKNSPTDETATDHRVKLTADENFLEGGLLETLKLGRLPDVVTSAAESIKRKKDVLLSHIDESSAIEQTEGISDAFSYTSPNTAEGIRLEVRPSTTAARDDDINMNVLKLLSKHVAIKPKYKSKSKPKSKNDLQRTTVLTTYPDAELQSSKSDTSQTTTKAIQTQEQVESENALIFASKRNLLSSDFDNSNDFPNIQDTTGDTEWYKNNFGDFFQKFNLKNQNSTNDLALQNYIERAKQKNIRIFSTANPDLNNFSVPVEMNTESSNAAPIQINYAEPITLDTIVSINKSGTKVNDDSNNSALGKIMMTVKNPDLGVEHINLMFDIPLVINIKDELMRLNDNYPNVNNQLEISPEDSIDKSVTALPSYTDIEGILKNKTIFERDRRNVHVTVNWTEFNSTKDNTIAPNRLTNDDLVNSNIPQRSIRSANGSDSENMTLSEFSDMISDWFQNLEDMKAENPKEKSDSESSNMLLLLDNSNETVASTESAYPHYESYMIKNIGHRSRVLLSIDKNEVNTTSTEQNLLGINLNVTTYKSDDPYHRNDRNITNSTSTTDLNNNKTTPDMEAVLVNNTSKRDTRYKVKAIFKRNADDSNLVFWNDIYDDEYGIQNDKLDKSVRDKHSVKDNDFIKRSGRWVHDKIKKFAENLKINPRTDGVAIHSGDEVKERVPRSVNQHGVAPYPRYYGRMYNRVNEGDQDDAEEDYLDADQKSIFTALAANMKDVCKKAAKAVQKSRNNEDLTNHTADNDSKQGIASALMQQLVRLLTDLVDYQVQQKTCTKLPSELQNFLEWLTYPKEEPEDSDQEPMTVKAPYQQEDFIDELRLMQNDEASDHSDELMNLRDKTVPVDIKSHYLDCLHNVQDLLDQYDDMTEDEKSKISGIKTYLDSQMRYLNKQISNINLYSLFEKQNAMRLKRELLAKKQHSTKHRPRGKLNKFIRKFGKKHTRTTAGYYDGVQITDMKRNTVKNEEKIDSTAGANFEKKLSKRNLKDVYYRAVAEAKKYATVKNIHKIDAITYFDTSTVHL